MAKQVRKPPSPSDRNDPRALEYFLKEVFEQFELTGSRTVDVPSIAAGGKQTFTITVKGCRPDQGQSVVVGFPSTISTDLVPWAFVSAEDTVTVVLRNPTGSPIDLPSVTYSAWVKR